MRRDRLLLLLLLLLVPRIALADQADDYVGRWLVDFHVPGGALAVIKDKYFDDLPPPWKFITIRQLLSHTAELPRESSLFNGMKRGSLPAHVGNRGRRRDRGAAATASPAPTRADRLSAA